MLSAEDVWTANKRYVSIPKKEELPPSSLQHRCSSPSLLYPAEPAQGEPPAHNPPTAKPWIWAVLNICCVLSPRIPLPPQTVCFHGEDRTLLSLLLIWRSRQPRRKQEDVLMPPRDRRDLKPHASAGGAGCSAPSSSGGSQHRSSSWEFPFWRKKAQCLWMLALPAPGGSCALASDVLTSVPATPLQPSAECHEWSFHLLLCSCILWATRNSPFRNTCVVLYVSLAERVCIEPRGSHSLCC